MSLVERVHDRLRPRSRRASAPRITIGDRVVMVELTDPEAGRLAGLAHRPQTAAGDVPTADPAALAGFATHGGSPMDRAVGVATLNALSAPLVDWRAGDPMAALSPAVSVVATVGLFRPAVHSFSDVTVRVIEREPPGSVEAPPGVAVETYTPAECERAVAGADVCFVTGSTLVYGGLDRYLAALSAADVTPVVLIGATASHVPEPAFAAGVDVVAGATVTDVDSVRGRVAAGDCGTDLHEHGLPKGYVTADEAVPGLELPTPTGATHA